ncbi:MAG: hypothetical protein ABWK01_03170 [Infirmifilum sp.]
MVVIAMRNRKKLLFLALALGFVTLLLYESLKPQHLGESSGPLLKSSNIRTPVTRTVFIAANVANARVIINGSDHLLPLTLRVPNGSHLLLQPQPFDVYEPVEKELNITVTDDGFIELHFIKAYAVLWINATAPVYVNSTLIRGFERLKAKIGSNLQFNSTCLIAGNDSLICSDTLVLARGNIEEYFALNATLPVQDDLNVTVNGHRYFVLHFYLPIEASVNASLRQGFLTLLAPENATLELSMTVSEKYPTGCRDYNSTHYLCIAGWEVPSWLSNTTLPPTLLRFNVRGGGAIGERLALISKYQVETVLVCGNCSPFKRVEDPFYDYRRKFGLADRYNVTLEGQCLYITTDSIARLMVILPATSGKVRLQICTKSWHASIQFLYLNGKEYVNVPGTTPQGGCYDVTLDLDYLKAYFEGKAYDINGVAKGVDFIDYNSSWNILTGKTRVLPNTGEFALDVYLEGETLKLCLIGVET